MVSSDYLVHNMKEMIGGCCVCSDERGWAENPLVYCDGHGCNVAVHQACYGIVQVPTGPWFCRKCESQERAARVRCELCPHKDGALKRTDNGGWAHVVCALYIPEVEFANVATMEPIVLQSVPHERYNKTCYICEEQGRESKAATGACMACNKHGCRQAFHVTCAQFAGLLCEEQGSDADNVKYCGYCKYHYSNLIYLFSLWLMLLCCPSLIGLLLGSSSSKTASSSSVVQPTSDFLSFSESSLRGVDSYTPPTFGRCMLKGSSEGGASEGMVALNTFGSLMSLPQSSNSGKHYENSHPGPELGGLASAGYKRPQPSSSSSSAASSSSTGEDGVKKKKRGNWRNRYGPCFTTQESKTPEAPEHCASLTVSSTSSTGVGSVGAGTNSLAIQKSPSLLRNGSLQSMTVSSPPTGAGNEDELVKALIPFSLFQPQSNSLPGPFNMAPSHMFGNRLNPTSAMAALIAQSENSPADQELGDGGLGFPRRGTPPKANLSPRSPLSGLHIRYDPSGPLVPGLSSSTDSLPPVATSIEQLLERQWNEGQQFLLQQGSQEDVLGMLKSLHQLQMENRRLEEQIRTLTMKKERLQLLSAQLSVPFTPASTTATTVSSPLYPSNTHTDMLNSKSIQLGSSVLTDSSQPLPTQDLLSGGHSSGSSTSSLSTPPSVAHSPPQQQQVNGVALQPNATANPSLPGMGVGGLMGALQGGHVAMSGIVGALNGVIQSSPGLGQNSSPLPHPSTVTTASLPMITNILMLLVWLLKGLATPIKSQLLSLFSSSTKIIQIEEKQEKLRL
uniref:MLLT10 histone lysine methyltransferase DOT1L cofactor n=1 Tax=Pygocentrus nattereri TaxID=42514 RepID=A0AAR2L3Z9_PYGNA